MNFLAHLYLSGDSDELLLGNFIGDYVKGRKYLTFSAEVQKGILLHRAIDAYTDSHPLVKEAADFFRPHYGRYAGIVTDVILDHFLARYWRDYSVYSLREFAKHVHAVLLSNFFQLPIRVKGFLPFLIQHKRLESYARVEGIQQSLHIMAHRTSLPDKTNQAMDVLETNFELLHELFDRFFVEIICYVEQQHGVQMSQKPTL
ncbi:ACP phosphodiesterase [Mangrovibacterium marinum]|uniref:Acyl carrier protein phosphodiesterase n=1 Tax=Mangrovibacterium marinum TaxID=1639118 RepID=A0A2T5BYB9_9BACT|nr:ACP phosphodiesterase [Mangrovibacterium marinum]PTN07234.1 acyl carrier protein phosphodiesterase [Mangrovibacterium marinum]